MKKKWYEIRETGIKEYPRYHLTHWNGNKQLNKWRYEQIKSKLS